MSAPRAFCPAACSTREGALWVPGHVAGVHDRMRAVDPSCDEVPQFEGCCEPTRRVCGVISGFAPGCQTESSLLTFPDPLKPCGSRTLDTDPNADAGAD